jgi:hypothetical protein
MILYILGAGFTLWMAVEAARGGKGGSWLWIILMFPPIGAAIYFFTEYLGEATPALRFRARKVSADEVRLAALDAKRLDTGVSWAQYASLLRGRRSFPEAVEAAQKAVQRTPRDPDALHELGRALLEVGRAAEAEGPLKIVCDKDPSYDKGDALLALAQAQEGAGKPADARASLELLAQRSARPEVLYHMARLQASLGDATTARASLQRIIDEAEFAPKYMRGTLRPFVNRARKGLTLLDAQKPLQ